MARDENAPWERGESFYNGGPIDAANLGGKNLEGKEFWFEEQTAGDSSAVGKVPQRKIVCRVVRNKSTIPLKPRKLVEYRDNTDAPWGTRVDGYTTGPTSFVAGVVDEYLPAAGIPVNDLFYIVVEGPTEALTVDTGLAALVIGDIVVPGTGTDILNNDAGKVNKQSLAGATTVLGGQIISAVGRTDQAQAVANSIVKIVMRRPV